jgi:ABC-type nitrate/sulfonate/bicarbonate transport system ATPase subunit/ABC-type nitrate/sulfonate/bicarbonate transport system permease component
MKRFQLIPTLLSILFLGLVWEIIALQIGFPAIFPSLADLLKETGRLVFSDNFFIEIIFTVLRGIIGIALAFILAFILATIAAFSIFWKAFFQPIIIVSRSIPIISLILIALLWFSPPQLPIFIALITMFPILYQNILTGLEQTDKRFLEMADVFRKSKSTQFFNIYLPSAKKVVFDGLKTAIGFGWRAIIIGEVLAQPIHGIGTSMKQAQAYINVSELIAWTVVAIGISYIFELIIKQIQKIHIEKLLPKAKEFKLLLNEQILDSKHIILSNINKSFNDIAVFKSLNFEFDSKSIICLKGSSGKGKTTLLRLLTGLEKPNDGEIYTGKLHFAYSFQDVRLLPWMTVSENIAYALNSKDMHKQEMSNLIAYLLKKMELTEHAHKYPNKLSGGQQQRVGLARALAAQSDVLLLDEPLNGLDNELKTRIIDFISKWIVSYKPLVIWATHEDIKLGNLEIKEIRL